MKSLHLLVAIGLAIGLLVLVVALATQQAGTTASPAPARPDVPASDHTGQTAAPGERAEPGDPAITQSTPQPSPPEAATQPADSADDLVQIDSEPDKEQVVEAPVVTALPLRTQTESEGIPRSPHQALRLKTSEQLGRQRAGEAAPQNRIAIAPQPPGDRDLGPGADHEPLGTIRLPRPSGESYGSLIDNPWRVVDQGHDSSTFSTDVDSASYSNVRRFLQRQQQRPPRDAVRIEEFINAFAYDYPDPDGDHPFALHAALQECPWATEHQILEIGIQGKRLAAQDRPPATLVFLLDVSGSMNQANKLPLLKQTFGLLVDQLDERDTVAIVTYAGQAGIALPPTAGDQRQTIHDAINRLGAGGSTAGAAGITEAYRLARAHSRPDGQTRVILGTDGDFNVGITDQEALVQLIRREAADGIFLNVLGFGDGNYQDARMEKISNDGNGVYAYIDSPREARRVFGRSLVENLVTLGKDVKIQLFWNPAHVRAWRLIGYANRLLKKEDFNDDTKDAGEVGAGHSVTALYEIVPIGGDLPRPAADANPFITPSAQAHSEPDHTGPELCRLRLRYKHPDQDRSILIEQDVDSRQPIGQPGWAAAMAGFGMLLRESAYRGSLDWPQLISLAQTQRGPDVSGDRAEAIRLMELARDLPLR